jgi:hypothetical protein
VTDRVRREELSRDARSLRACGQIIDRAGEVRRVALEALGAHPDERARDVLAAAALSVVEGVARWESSEGTVLGHRVVLVLDARRLGMVRSAPGVADELHVALSAATARRLREAMSELAFLWSGAPSPRQAAYRDAPPEASSQDLRTGLMEYADGSGEPELARLVSHAVVERRGPEARDVLIGVAAGDRHLALSPRAQAFFTRAVRDLLADDRALVTAR